MAHPAPRHRLRHRFLRRCHRHRLRTPARLSDLSRGSGGRVFPAWSPGSARCVR
jgi:hypothetical protein